MRKLALLIIICLAIAVGMSARSAHAFYDNYPAENIQFHPQHPDYYDGNLRLQLKKRADIERASAPNVHYDKYSGDYYSCNWKYNKNLGTWVCEKSQSAQIAAQPVRVNVCPYGYLYNTSLKTCSAVIVPANASLNSRGDGWVCNAGYKTVTSGCVKDQNHIVYANTGSSSVSQNSDQTAITRYVYYYDEEGGQEPKEIKTISYKMPDRLASTGAGFGFTLFSGAMGMLAFVARRIYKML